MTVGSLLIKGRADMSGVHTELDKTAKAVKSVASEAKDSTIEIARTGEEMGKLRKSTADLVVGIAQVTNALVLMGEALIRVYTHMQRVRQSAAWLLDKWQFLSRQSMRLGFALTTEVTLPIAGVGFAAIRAASNLETLRLGMQSVMGSAEDAAREVERLRVVALGPGLGFEEAVQGSVRLQATGASADMAAKALKEFGNALATVGGGPAELSEVMTAMSQMVSVGKILSQDIKQIAMRVPQLRQAMADAFGTADLDAIRNMGLTSEEFLEGVLAELEKLPRAANASANAAINLGEAFRGMWTAIGEPMLPIWTAFLNAFGATLNAVTLIIRAIPTPIKQVIGVVAVLVASLGPLLLIFGLVTAAVLWWVGAMITLRGIIKTIKVLEKGRQMGIFAKAAQMARASVDFFRVALSRLAIVMEKQLAILRFYINTLMGYDTSNARAAASTNALAASQVRLATTTKAATASLAATMAPATPILTRMGGVASTVFHALTFGMLRSSKAGKEKVGMLKRLSDAMVGTGKFILKLTGGFSGLATKIGAVLTSKITVLIAAFFALKAVFASVARAQDKFTEEGRKGWQEMEAGAKSYTMAQNQVAEESRRGWQQMANDIDGMKKSFAALLAFIIGVVYLPLAAAFNGMVSSFKRAWDSFNAWMLVNVPKVYTIIREKLFRKAETEASKSGFTIGQRMLMGVASALNAIGGTFGAKLAETINQAVHEGTRGAVDTDRMDLPVYTPFVINEDLTDEVTRLSSIVNSAAKGTGAWTNATGRLKDIYGQVNTSIGKLGDATDENAQKHYELAKQINDVLNPKEAKAPQAKTALEAMAEAASAISTNLRLVIADGDNISGVMQQATVMTARLDSVVRQMGDRTPAAIRQAREALREGMREAIDVQFRIDPQMDRLLASVDLIPTGALEGAIAQIGEDLRMATELREALGGVLEVPAGLNERISKLARGYDELRDRLVALPDNVQILAANVDLIPGAGIGDAMSLLTTELGRLEGLVVDFAGSMDLLSTEVPQTLRDNINGVVEALGRLEERQNEMPAIFRLERPRAAMLEAIDEIAETLQMGKRNLDIGFAALKTQFTMPKETGMAAMNMLGDAALGAAMAMGPLAMVGAVLSGLFEKLWPMIDALMLPLVMLGQVLASMLMPVFRLLFPVIKGVAIVLTILHEVVARVAQGLSWAVGSAIRGIGEALNKIPFLKLGNPLIAAGNALLGFSQGMGEAAAESARIREELRAMNFDDALDRVTNGLDKLATSTIGAVQGFKALDALRYNATSPTLANLAPVVPTPGDDTPIIQGGTLNMPVTINTSGDGRETYHNWYDEVDRQTQGNAVARAWFITLPEPI